MIQSVGNRSSLLQRRHQPLQGDNITWIGKGTSWNAQVANRPQSHIQRERARGREALEFCRRAILNASGLLVVAPRYEESDRLVHCRVELLDETGDRADLGALLVKNGFASREVLDWGRRVPR